MRHEITFESPIHGKAVLYYIGYKSNKGDFLAWIETSYGFADLSWGETVRNEYELLKSWLKAVIDGGRPLLPGDWKLVGVDCFMPVTDEVRSDEFVFRFLNRDFV